ncbi:putative thiamine transporter SLC35F3 isoform X1 [Limulus polyphemus]|uniref:Thiamine transporter SLC35F3 isoform X1 n=1 Tax=Limulus polyphemus TaxID=6850 RepID=A0ABM1TBH1_LIMPO|nr:putative thiamine transporter SLC35F3 isoform X1 [Limulus polyphemus]
MVIGEESVHTRPRIQSLRSVTKLRSPPAVVITDDSDTFTGINPTLSDTALSSVEPLHDSPSLMQSSPTIERCSSISKIHGIFHSGAFNRPSIGSLRSCSQEGFQVLHNQSSSEFQTDISHVSNNYHGDITDDNQSPNSTKGFQCCSKKLPRIILGIFLKLLFAGSWAGAAHLLKLTYISTFHLASDFAPNVTTGLIEEAKINVVTSLPTMTPSSFNAPFFTTWFCTMWNIFFFPIYLGSRALTQPEKDTTKKVIFECVRQFHEKGFTTTQFFGRCSLFCLLSIVTKYMFIYSIGILDTTDVLALFSSRISFIYLLSWVVLHQQFVGLKIVAVILCNTGIAMLAYMDGVAKTPTLGGVLLASASAAGSAIYGVFFKKLIGDVTPGQLSIFFTLMGLMNFLIMWPFFITLHVMHIETLHWNMLPWIPLGGTAALFLVANLIGSFGIVWTYEVFLTLGIVLAVPASAVIDIYIYGVVFKGMRLAGILLITLGFLLVLLPNNWPDYINILLRMRRMYQKRSKSRLTEKGSLNDHKSRLRNANGAITGQRKRHF